MSNLTLAYEFLEYVYDLAEREKLIPLVHADITAEFQRMEGRGNLYVLRINVFTLVKCIGGESIVYSITDLNYVERERKIVKVLKQINDRMRGK